MSSFHSSATAVAINAASDALAAPPPTRTTRRFLNGPIACNTISKAGASSIATNNENNKKSTTNNQFYTLPSRSSKPVNQKSILIFHNQSINSDQKLQKSGIFQNRLSTDSDRFTCDNSDHLLTKKSIFDQRAPMPVGSFHGTQNKLKSVPNDCGILGLSFGLGSTRSQNGPQQHQPVRLKPFTSKEKEEWITGRPNRGFIRIFEPTSKLNCSIVVPCSLSTTVEQIASKLGASPYQFHVHLSGDVIRRLGPKDCPLTIQNGYLSTIGVTDLRRQTEVGDYMDLGYLIRFFAGKPVDDDGFGHQALSAYCMVKMGKIFPHWARKLCIMNGTRLLIYPDLDRKRSPSIIPLSQSKVEEQHLRSKGRCIKVSPTMSKLASFQTVYLSFDTTVEFNAWLTRCVKAAAKIPPISDLSNLHLECLPEQVFCIGSDRLILQLNLRKNILRERPVHEDCFLSIGWLDDLPRLQSLRSLNLADNELMRFPMSLLQLPALTELNLAGNKLRHLPIELSQMQNLRTLNLQNNFLSELPQQISECQHLTSLDLSFNLFSSPPEPVLRMTGLTSWNLAGNCLQRISPVYSDTGFATAKLEHVKKLEVRHCGLKPEDPTTSLLPLDIFQNLTHLDIRDNANGIQHLDLRNLPYIQVLNCQRNSLISLQLNGTSLLSVFASHNDLRTFVVMPVPLNLRVLNVSRNCLTKIPEWLAEITRIERIVASWNRLMTIPHRLFTNVCSLKFVDFSHNEIHVLPCQFENCFIEVCLLHHNRLTMLPNEFLSSAHKLKTLNLAQNLLTELPPLNPYADLNKVQTLVLASNRFTDEILQVISGYRRLRNLDLSYNCLRNIDSSAVQKLVALEELNLSGNRLQHLSNSLVELPDLTVLRLHSNRLVDLPNFSACTKLRVLDVGNNCLETLDVQCFLAPELRHLDISCNNRLRMDSSDFKHYQTERLLSLVDISRQVELPSEKQKSSTEVPWQAGFSETSGDRNKLCISQIRMPVFREQFSDALFAILDGGLNNEIPALLKDTLADIVREELIRFDTGQQYLKYSMLTAHRTLKEAGQKLGASCVLCHICATYANSGDNDLRKQPDNVTNNESGCKTDCGTGSGPGSPSAYVLRLANVGNAEAVLCRGGEPVVLTKRFGVAEQPEEYDRIRNAGGIVTEDNEINGITQCSRLLGSSFLAPLVVPNPHVTEIQLSESDEFLVIASRGLWDVICYAEVVHRIRRLHSPVQAVKHLQDIAQAYGFRENLSIIVLQFFFGPTAAGGACHADVNQSERPDIVAQPVTFELRTTSSTVELNADADETSLSDFDVQSEPPQGRGKIKASPPNYYFDYKKKLKELAPQPDWSETDEATSSALSSQLSSVLTLVPTNEREGDDCSMIDMAVAQLAYSGGAGLRSSITVDESCSDVPTPWASQGSTAFCQSLDHLSLERHDATRHDSDSSSSSGLGKSEFGSSPHHSGCETPMELRARDWCKCTHDQHFSQSGEPTRSTATRTDQSKSSWKMSRGRILGESLASPDCCNCIRLVNPNADQLLNPAQRTAIGCLEKHTLPGKALATKHSFSKYFDRLDQVILKRVLQQQQDNSICATAAKVLQRSRSAAVRFRNDSTDTPSDSEQQYHVLRPHRKGKARCSAYRNSVGATPNVTPQHIYEKPIGRSNCCCCSNGQSECCDSAADARADWLTQNGPVKCGDSQRSHSLQRPLAEQARRRSAMVFADI